MTFWASGLPVPEGGLRIVRVPGRQRLAHQAGPRLRAWRNAVAWAAREANAVLHPRGTPVQVSCTFWIVRPASHYGTGRNRDRLRDDAPAFPVGEGTGDVDKLERAVLDALTGISYETDAQVVSGGRSKQYAPRGSEPGVHVTVTGPEKAPVS